MISRSEPLDEARAEPSAASQGELHSSSTIRAIGGADFQSLYMAHFDRVYRLVMRYGVEPADAEDVTQQVFLIAHRILPNLITSDRPDAWLRAITVRVTHKHFRWWKSRRPRTGLLDTGPASASANELSPEREAAAGEEMRCVRKVLQKMSRKLRDALVLLDVEGMSPREASELLGVSLNTMRSRRLLARTEFKRLWARFENHEDLKHE